MAAVARAPATSEDAAAGRGIGEVVAEVTASPAQDSTEIRRGTWTLFFAALSKIDWLIQYGQ